MKPKTVLTVLFAIVTRATLDHTHSVTPIVTCSLPKKQSMMREQLRAPTLLALALLLSALVGVTQSLFFNVHKEVRAAYCGVH